jgi:predicted CopG family antitoxin
MEKQNLTIKISVDTYHQLRSDIGRGRISEFIESLVNRELGGTEKKIEQEYRECYANPRMLKEAKQ